MVVQVDRSVAIGDVFAMFRFFVVVVVAVGVGVVVGGVVVGVFVDVVVDDIVVDVVVVGVVIGVVVGGGGVVVVVGVFLFSMFCFRGFFFLLEKQRPMKGN